MGGGSPGFPHERAERSRIDQSAEIVARIEQTTAIFFRVDEQVPPEVQSSEPRIAKSRLQIK